MSTVVAVELSIHPDPDPRRVRLTWPDGTTQPVVLAALRHRCGCPACAHPGGQRLLDPAALPADLHLAAAALVDGRIIVSWGPDGHRSTYDVEELRPAAHAVPPAAAPPATPPWDAGPWDAATMHTLPQASYRAISLHPHELVRWLAAVESSGFALLSGVPIHDGAVAEVAEMFGHVRVTNYGRFFDVRSIVDPTNLADTALGLGAHTDNPYRDPVPTLQLLHCLSSSAAGGESFLVDGFRVAAELRSRSRKAFDALASTAVTFTYRDERTELTARAPVIGLDPAGEPRALRFNSRSMVPPVLPPDELADWYDAYLLLARLVADERYHVRFRMAPGDLFVVDNRRVLHGRTAFEPASGSRHLQGCYADIDGLRSTLAVLRRELRS